MNSSRVVLVGLLTGLLVALAPACGAPNSGTDGGSGGGAAGGSGGGTAGGSGGGTAGGSGGGTAGGSGGGTAGGVGGGTAGGAGGGTAGGAGGGTAGGSGGGTAGGSGGGTAGGAGGGTAGGSGGGTAGGSGGGTAGGSGGGTAGGSGGGSGVDGGYTSYDAFCADLIPKFCTYLTRCGATSSQSSCIQYYGRFVDPANCGYQEKPAIKDGRLTFDGGAGQRCLDAYATTFSCVTPEYETNIDCLGAQAGTVANGGSCFFDGECAPTAYCTGTGSSCPGTCQPRKAAGSTVTSTNSQRECQAGLYIYGTQCMAYVPANGSCAPIGATGYPQSCVGTHYCSAANTCVVKKVGGVSCASSDQCAVPNVCSNGTCAPRGAVGSTCNSNPSLPCAYDLYCDSATYAGLGSCKTSATAGQGCWSAWDCQSGLYCSGMVYPSGTGTGVRGTCAARKAVGATCGTDYDECGAGLFCSAGLCAAKKSLGAVCADYTQCGAHLTCSTTCQPDACYDPTP